MVSVFYKNLLRKTILSLGNDHKDNYDLLRFGDKKTDKFNLSTYIYNLKFITDRFFNKSNYIAILNNYSEVLKGEDFYKLEWFNDTLEDDESKELMIDIIAFRMLGYAKVKLSVNNPEYWKKLKKCTDLEQKGPINIDLDEFKLCLFNLKDLGYDIKIYFLSLGVLVDFVLEQYSYKSINKTICVDPGDIVIDAGGCWGDTALYFASRTGDKGKVFSFEFIPKNLKIFKTNLSLNPMLASRIEIVENPVWEESDMMTYYVDRGPASSVSFEKIEGNVNNSVRTKTIDALVREKNLSKVDFIKMDIEGAEPFALKGAEETIRKYKPKLAIAIYHSMNDFVNIPEYIDSLNLGYKFYLAHYTIHEEETILFATTG